MQSTALAGLLRELRSERGVSLRDAARSINVDPSYLSRVERGVKISSAEVRERAANFYRIPTEVLALADGVVPADIVRILQRHPELVDRIRTEFADATPSR